MGLFGFGKKKIKKYLPDNYEQYLISYLNEYTEIEFQLLLPEVVRVLNNESEWKSILSIDIREERVQKTIKHWEKYSQSFQILIDLMKERLVSIDTVLYEEKLTVVYSFQRDDGILYYLGNLPLSSDNELISKFPSDIQSFYKHVHNGFVLFGLGNMGPMPIDNFYCLGDDLLQEEFLDHFCVNDTYMIFSNGGGDGIVYDLSKHPPIGFTYFHDDYDMCNFKQSPVNIMCAWIKIAITED